MTVKELRELIKDIPDDWEIKSADDNGDLFEVEMKLMAKKVKDDGDPAIDDDPRAKVSIVVVFDA